MELRKIQAVLLLVGISALTWTGCAQQSKTDQHAYKEYGIRCMEKGDYDDAIDAFQLALNQAKGHVGQEEIDICFYKAETYYLKGDLEQTREMYDAIIDFKKEPRAYYLRGCLNMRQGRMEDASQDFAAAVKRNKNDYEMYIGIYEALLANGMEKDGQKYLEQALEIKNDESYDKMQKGRIYAIRGEYEEAVKLLEEASGQGEIRADLYLSWIYQQNGQSARAQTSLRKYLDGENVDVYEVNRMGGYLFQSGDYPAAIRYFEEALKINPDVLSREERKQMIFACESIYDFEKAKTHIQEYLELYPDDSEMERESVFLQSR